MGPAFAKGGRQRILEQGMALSGLERVPQQAEALLDIVAGAAAAWCGRKDIPGEMESCMAILLARALKDGTERPVSSVKRGDTAITYAGQEDTDLEALLAPFVRLKTPQRGRQWR